MRILTLIIGTFLCALALPASAQLQIITGTHWVCDSSSHTYLVLHNTGLQHNGQPTSLMGSILKFSGDEDVSFGAASNPAFNIIEINKTGSSRVQLQNTVRVMNKLRFQSGLLHLFGHNILLGPGAELQGERETARVLATDGGTLIARAVLDAPVAVNPGNLGAIISSKRNLGEVLITRGHSAQRIDDRRSILRFYDIQPTNNRDLDAELQFHYLDAELNGLPENQLALWRQESNNVPWQNTGSGRRNLGDNLFSRDGIGSFSRWTLAVANSVVPLTWHSFVASCGNNRVRIDWKTSSEQNTRFFIIQRSNNGQQWTAMDTLAAAGISNSLLSYTYQAAQEFAGMGQYRIRQEDLDGRFTYSSVLRVRCGGEEPFSAYPNPVDKRLTISMQHSGRGLAVIRMYNTAGSLVKQFQQPLQHGNNVFPLAMDGIVPGVYLLSITTRDGAKQLKIIKQ